MKLLNILFENNWRPLTSAEIEDDKDELFKMIDTAYSPLGGHPNVKNAGDVEDAADGYEVIDLDDDPEDNSKPAKSAAVARTVSSLNKNGYYIEVSGKIFDILKAKGVAIVNDEETVRKALKGKEIVWHGDGSYDRVIGGMKLRKVMMGKPKVT